MSEGPFIAFYPSDWLAGTRGLTAAETGVYITLVSMMYERGEPLDQDAGRLARACGLPKASFLRALDTLIAEKKIIETPKGLWQKRVSEELNRRRNIRDTASKAAKTRWEKSKQNQSPDYADAMPTQCGNDANQNQNQSITDTDVSVSEKPKAKRKSRIGEDAEITDAMRTAADKRGHSQQEAEAQFQKFKNDAIAKGKTFVDWNRAFITWLDSEYFRPITTQRTSEKETGAEHARRIAEIATRGMDFGTSQGDVVPLLSARPADRRG